MRTGSKLVLYVFLFFCILLILRLTGLLSITMGEIVGYGFIFWGAGIVYQFLGKNNNQVLFAGVFLFLTGIFLFVIYNFEFFFTGKIIFPAILFMCSAGFFILFLNNFKQNTFLFASLVMLISGSIITAGIGNLQWHIFIYTIKELIISIIPVFIVFIIIIIILNFKKPDIDDKNVS